MRVTLNQTDIYLEVVGPELDLVDGSLRERPTLLALHGGPGFDHGYLRLTMERWVAFDGDTAYVDVAVTGRRADEEGLRDLLTRTADSMQEVEAEA